MKIRWKKLVWLCLVMLLGVLSVKGSATHVDAAIIDSEGYTVINTVAEFDTLLRSNLSGKYRLGADIDLSTKNWTPIGSQSGPFRGILDGNGHTIRGLWGSKGVNNRGLFSWLTGATIRNLNIQLDRRGFTGLSTRGGALAGTAYAGTLIEQVHVQGLAGSRMNHGGQYIGGLVGVLDGSSIAQSSVSDIEVYGSNEVGGLVGLVDNGSTIGKSFTNRVIVKASTYDAGGVVGKAAHDSRLTCCFALDTDVMASHHAGGLVGLLEYSTAEKSAAQGMVRVNSSYAGGFAGELRSGRIANSYAKASVTGTSYIGGFIGTGYKSTSMQPEIYNSYSASSVFASSYAGAFMGRGTILYSGRNFYDGNIANIALVNGTSSYVTGALPVGKTTADMKKRATFVGWDFNNIWLIEEGQSYPELECMGWWEEPGPVDNVTITFHPEGGTGTMPDQIAERGSQVTLNANQFVREDYVFLGWSTVSNGEVEYADQASLTAVDDVDLFAVWGAPNVELTGSSDKSRVDVGEKVEFTFNLENIASDNSTSWYNVKMYPKFNEYFAFGGRGSVVATLNGVTISGVTYDPDNDWMVIPVGELKPGDIVKVTVVTTALEPAQGLDVSLPCDAEGDTMPTTRAGSLQAAGNTTRLTAEPKVTVR